MIQNGVKKIHEKYEKLKKLHTQAVTAFKTTHGKVHNMTEKYSKLQAKYYKLVEAYERAKHSNAQDQK